MFSVPAAVVGVVSLRVHTVPRNHSISAGSVMKLAVEVAGIPVEQHPADVEYDGRDDPIR